MAGLFGPWGWTVRYLGLTLKCLSDTSVLAPKCPDTSDPPEQCQSVSVPICLRSEVSGYLPVVQVCYKVQATCKSQQPDWLCPAFHSKWKVILWLAAQAKDASTDNCCRECWSAFGQQSLAAHFCVISSQDAEAGWSLLFNSCHVSCGWTIS